MRHTTTRYVVVALLGILLISLILPLLDGLDAFGYANERTYLIIFQDNSEIRNTGGIMACMGLLTVYHGSVTSLQVFYANSTYLNGTVKVDGPESLTKFFNVTSARLFDSNVQYNFSSFAPVVQANLYNLTGKRVDGTVAVDFTAVQELMKLTGPMIVSGDVITSENVVDRLHYYSSISQGEKSPLTDLLHALALDIIGDVRGSSLPAKLAFLTTAQQLMKEGHLQFYLPGNSLLQSFESAQKRPAGDFISIIDANLGSAKADFGVNRTVSDDVTIFADGSTISNLTITYINHCWWQYNVFSTVLVPPGAELIAVRNSTRAFEGPLITNGTGFSAFSAHLGVLAGSTASVTYVYKLPKNVHGNGIGNHYDLYFEKQAGINEYTLNTTVELPQGSTVIKTENVGVNQTSMEDIHAQVIYT
ncbi:MAG: DUF4012 domain-containing protein [Halobacteriota archaeon]